MFPSIGCAIIPLERILGYQSFDSAVVQAARAYYDIVQAKSRNSLRNWNV